jgi:hypothetical protein
VKKRRGNRLGTHSQKQFDTYLASPERKALQDYRYGRTAKRPMRCEDCFWWFPIEDFKKLGKGYYRCPNGHVSKPFKARKQ